MDSSNFLILQIILASAMLLVTCIAGCAPLLLLTVMKRKGKDQTKNGWLSYLSCFSGGVFMATCFLDIMPHIAENYEKFVNTYKIDPPVPLSQLFICLGFFLVYLIEEVTARVFGGGDGHGHSHGAPPKKESKENITRQSLLPTSNNLHDNNHPQLLRHTSLVVEEASPWVVSDEKSNMLKSLTFAVAMSFHSLLEGFALGVQDTTTGIYALFFSLLLHKSIESFSVGLQISKTNSSKYVVVVITILIYALMTPLGSVLGTVLQNTKSESLWKDGLILLLESMAAGTFIYVTFLEILAQEKENHFNSLKQLLSIAAGFILILILQIVFGHDHEQAHVHPVGVNASVSHV
ncbi:unnamed protein product [Caenorhabditis angaria]|uniref:Uncharacterized protein n=1 Tax=Caenorhabditis angaria TaxID=860376 RepID=A0A9P1N335_9PELO|nr:unnamed protein product [Caenorhabditis angaria]